MVTHTPFVLNGHAPGHRLQVTFDLPTADHRIPRNTALSSSSQYSTESDDSRSIPKNPFQSWPRPSWDVPSPATGLGGVRPQQQQKRPKYHPFLKPADALWSSPSPRFRGPHAAAVAPDKAQTTTRNQMWTKAALGDDHRLDRPRPPVVLAAAKDETQKIRDQVWAAAGLGHRLSFPGPPGVVAAHGTGPWSRILPPPPPPPPFPHLRKANYRAPYAQDEEYAHIQLFADESVLDRGLVHRSEIKADIEDWLDTSTVTSSQLGSPAYSSSSSLESSASSLSQISPAKATLLKILALATSLVSRVKATPLQNAQSGIMTSVSPLSKLISMLLFIWTTLVGVMKEGLVCLVSVLTTVTQYVVFVVAADLVSIGFGLVEFVVFVLWWVLNKAANMLHVCLTGRVPTPSQNMSRDNAGWTTVQSTSWN